MKQFALIWFAVMFIVGAVEAARADSFAGTLVLLVCAVLAIKACRSL